MKRSMIKFNGYKMYYYIYVCVCVFDLVLFKKLFRNEAIQLLLSTTFYFRLLLGEFSVL